MSDLAALYHQLILQHHRQPHNTGELEKPTLREEGHNPLCGDQVVVTIALAAGALSEIRCEAKGCALCRASASLMTLALQGKSCSEAQALCVSVSDAFEPPGAAELPGDLSVLTAVSEVPSRIGCVTLPWQAVDRALAPQIGQ